MCVSHEEEEKDCKYDLVYYGCDGPECIPGLVQTVENDCKWDPLCRAITAGNLCNLDPEDNYWITVAYTEAELQTPWDCNLEYCFYDCENAVFYPECEVSSAKCPGSS